MNGSDNQLDGFISRSPVPATFAEQVELSSAKVGEWRESRHAVSELRARPREQLPWLVMHALRDASEIEAHWLHRLESEFGVVPPIRIDRRLTSEEFGRFVEARWNFEYWRLTRVRIVQAMASAASQGLDSITAGWNAVCYSCENQALELDGGLVTLAASLGIGASVPTASVAAWARSGISRKNQRLRESILRLAREQDVSPQTALLGELQSAVVLALRDPDPARTFVTQVASEVEKVGQKEKVGKNGPPVESLDEFEVREAAEHAMREAAGRALADVESELLRHQWLATARLSEREASVWDLHRDGLRNTEIAEKLGIKPGTVAALLSRATSKLVAVARREFGKDSSPV